MAPLKEYIRLLRPHQYLKNLFIFAPVFFDFKLTNLALVTKSILAFILFSLVASGVYIFNDLKDIEEDRKHPIKRNRPLASGAISMAQAAGLMVVLFVVGLAAAYVMSLMVFLLLLFYVLLNISYTLRLKHIAVLDISLIALGFVLRLFVGSEATGIELSMWVILMTYLLALFLALAKRRDDLAIYLAGGEKTRKVIDGYSMDMLNSLMGMMATVVVVSYIMYTVSPPVLTRMGTDKLYLTVIWVLLGFMRYIQITMVEGKSGSPTSVLIRDRFIQISVLGWVLTFLLLGYHLL